ncbi:putative Flp pilus-assembly TadE/G-like protein [Collimonas sp. PA-H2]|uniref:pilus assembly protein TadG-related protein n=1 Tax=Collimonas sp. PA-H2 TaxID=1881062 RepID=UPI000C014028|nr:pilus assembly protein TadG-related protein [Collimonas sp. PA-H2]PFH09442.1 putative Flp pilus-assembly TadE/G-like protein [Collimonas sp. PA-H2]
MPRASFRRSWPAFKGRRFQQGQALIYGIFVLIGGLAALFFLFNTGQLSREKTKLVNTSDAVAYSAGVMHARALNYIAYTNRAMVANEVTIAQMVSLSSWAQYTKTHAESTAQLGCETYYTAEPVAKGMALYIPVCFALYYANIIGTVEMVSEAVQVAAEAMVIASDAAKAILQASQVTMLATLPIARKDLMQQVANANYVNDGSVEVDTVPLLDTFFAFDGSPVMQRYSGDQRERFAQVTKTSANLDPFVPVRHWRSTALVPGCIDPLARMHFDYVNRAGGTELIGYDEWRALDTASIYRYHPQKHRWRPFTCDVNENALGYGKQSANDGNSSGGGGTVTSGRENSQAASMASSNDWNYTGLPGFFELSDKALAYTPDNADKSKQDPKIRFAIRLRRQADQTATSDARSRVKPSAHLNNYQGAPAGGYYASVSASEVFFARPVPRADGKTELASLFNPYWQVHLIEVPDDIKAVAQALQGTVLPP